MNLKVNELTPWLCKLGKCLKIATYEFTNARENEDGEIETTVVGHACGNHVTDVNDMLKDIYYRSEDESK
tara:strand:+ start:887 stop:1096 length:210 start_codon:yes stop_codon:yes gene_type:complete